MARSTSGESLLSRVVRIYEAFGPDHRAVTLSELALRSDLPLATASRLVNELIEHGWLRRDAQRRICVGVRMWELASRAAPTLGLQEAAIPFMSDLHAAVGNHVQLGVLQERDVLYIERLSAPRAIRNRVRVAGRLPLHATSSGLVLLAHAPAEMQEAELSRPLTALTRHTITDPAILRSTLSEIRHTGVAYCPGFVDEDATGIAVPIRTTGGRVVAALSVLVPNEMTARTAIPALRAAGRGISRLLGDTTEVRNIA
ncbi:helix-turn-helix domain-containing protein [Nocardia sp. SYP-A9097]|uniref:IclR family transcriptional regulator n=1 Tax=Nocardia sp. SYP-A9097 TaxID=2663237 RepID=UPI00129A30D2|nr:IclR family transcriptional regulator [Nocardia sp. SYP-A9097]MRH88969.1 helix-turn-helix domain-containing protein [Nocardia sp. SYP-A9097]